MTTVTTAPLFGAADQDLNGAESRALRTSLNLERRHVVLLAEALAFTADPVTTARVTQWERSTGRGYPRELVALLNTLDAAVERRAAPRVAPEPDVKSHRVLRRPLGGRRIAQLLDLAAHGLPLTPRQFEVLDREGGDIWQCLMDATITRAALRWRLEGRPALRVVLDKEPEPAPPARPLAYRVMALRVDYSDNVFAAIDIGSYGIMGGDHVFEIPAPKRLDGAADAEVDRWFEGVIRGLPAPTSVEGGRRALLDHVARTKEARGGR